MPLLAIPFFILTGNLMNRLEMTRRIFDFINAVLGSLRGGLAHVSVARQHGVRRNLRFGAGRSRRARYDGDPCDAPRRLPRGVQRGADGRRVRCWRRSCRHRSCSSSMPC